MKKKVPHFKVGNAKVSMQLRGKRIELTIVIPPDIAERIATRLYNRKKKRDKKKIEKVAKR